MTTTTVLSDDTATIVQDEVSRFNWGAVVAGAVIATAITFFLISAGSGLGLALTSARSATATGIKAFLSLGAIYFIAAQAFGFAVGGHITGRLIGTPARECEEETFLADAHGLAVWALAVVFGLALLAVTATATASGTAAKASTPSNYWADKLLRSANVQQSTLAYKQYAQAGAPVSGADAAAQTPATATTTDASRSGPMAPSGVSSTPAGMPSIGGQPTTLATLADAKEEAATLLTVDTVAGPNSDSEDHRELARLVSQFAGLSGAAANDRVNAVETDMRAKAKEAADAARKAASYLAIWTALALLFSAVVCVVATVSARLKDDRNMFGRSRPGYSSV